MREAERLQSQGDDSAGPQEAGLQQTFYRRRIKCGALKEDEAIRVKQPEQENATLKHIVVEQAPYISMLKDLSKGRF